MVLGKLRAAVRAAALALGTSEAEIPPDIALGDYIRDYWLPVIKRRVEYNTYRTYEIDSRIHIPDALKAQPIRTIRRGQLKRMLAGLDGQIAPATQAKVANVVRSIFANAQDDEIIESNPAEKIGRALGLRHFYVEKVRPMTPEHLALFLAVAREREAAHWVTFSTLAYSGIRIGESRGLQTTDVDLPGRKLAIERQVLEDGSVVGPKGRRGNRKTRVVDLSEDLAAILEPFLSARREFDMKMGRRSPWLLYPDMGAVPTFGTVSTVTHRLRRAMQRILVEAKLPESYTPHTFRHTFATLMLTRGEDLLYVSRQIGDTLPITAEIYGRWARVPPKAGGTNLLSVRQPVL